MAPSEDNGPLDSADPNGEAPDLDEALQEVEIAEQHRYRKGLKIGLAVAAVAIAVLGVLVWYGDALFEPDVPVQKGERQVIDDTDDPQCRRMIGQVTNIGHTFMAMESRVESAVPGDDRKSMTQLLREIENLKERLRDAEELSTKANLRFERSSEELDRWFEYTQNELSILSNLIERAQPASDGPRSRDTGVDASARDVGPGNAERDAGLDAGSDATGGTTVDEMSNEEIRLQRDKTLAALHDAFEKFRVWHTASYHPCGSNEKGETPWRPADAGTGGATAPDAGP